jgi:hypothetical protein
VGFVVNKAAVGQVFSEYFGFPCESSFHQLLHHHNRITITQGWHTRPIGGCCGYIGCIARISMADELRLIIGDQWQ